MKFFEIKDDDKYTLLWWAEGMGFEKIPLCPKYPEEHMTGGKRIGKLKLKIKGKRIGDFIWTWYSECLITDRVAAIFNENNVTGYELWPVEIINKELSYKVWELRTLGWAGMAPKESGIKLDLEASCEYCGHKHYTSMKEPKNLIELNHWDGNDIFMVWPLPAFKFVSQKVIDIIKKENLTGVKIIPVENLPLDRYDSGFSPSRLSYHMPDERARLLGEPLGIY